MCNFRVEFCEPVGITRYIQPVSNTQFIIATVRSLEKLHYGIEIVRELAEHPGLVEQAFRKVFTTV